MLHICVGRALQDTALRQGICANPSALSLHAIAHSLHPCWSRHGRLLGLHGATEGNKKRLECKLQLCIECDMNT